MSAPKSAASGQQPAASKKPHSTKRRLNGARGLENLVPREGAKVAKRYRGIPPIPCILLESVTYARYTVDTERQLPANLSSRRSRREEQQLAVSKSPLKQKKLEWGTFTVFAIGELRSRRGYPLPPRSIYWNQ